MGKVRRPKKDWKEEDDDYKKYKLYIKSSEFDEVRQAVLKRDGYHCMCCGRTNDETTLAVHHNSYNHLYDELNHLDDCVTVCSVCHLSIHRNKANWIRFKRTK